MTSPLILYGGTFNPIHRGHIGICRTVHEKFPDGEIILMPTAIPPHKENRDVIDGQHRYAMCKIAATGLPYIRVSDYELGLGGKSYTIETLCYLKAKFPNRPLYLLVGTDMFLTFREWRSWQKIGELAILLVASREDNDTESLRQMQLSLTTDGVSSILLQNNADVVASTDIRQELKAEGKSDALPQEVQQYILEHELYGTRWNDNCLEYLRKIAKSMTTDDRFFHTIAVEQEAAKLAVQYGADPQKAAACGILHDVCKNMPFDLMLQLVADSGIITDIPFKCQPQLLHGYAGSVYMQSKLKIDDEDMIAAVRYHTTARAGMSKLEKIIYLADLTSADRTYPDVQILRDITSRSLEEGMRYSLRYIVCRLVKDGNYLCKDTAAAYNHYFGYTNNSNI